MNRVALAVIDGCEEIEALTVVDVLRRGGVDIKIVSLSNNAMVQGKHQILFQSDLSLEEAKKETFAMLIIPGGTTAYLDHADFLAWVKQFDAEEKKIAAICAAPAVLGSLGLLQGKKATIYPDASLESLCKGCDIQRQAVVVDGRYTTGQGPSASIAFALELLGQIQGSETAEQVKKAMLA